MLCGTVYKNTYFIQHFTFVRIQAFDIFKIFVLNPRKSDQIVKILTSGKEKIIRTVSEIKKTKNPAGFMREKAMVLKILTDLQ